jgi:AraC family transcriptional regulator
MKTGFVYLRPRKVVFVRETGPYTVSSLVAWKRIFAWLESEGRLANLGEGYGLARDNPREVAPEACRYDACLEFEEWMERQLPADFRVQMLPGGSYIRQRHSGPHERIREQLASLRDDWVPHNALSLDPRRPLIAIHLNHPQNTAPEQLRTDLCVPVMPVPRSIPGVAA